MNVHVYSTKNAIDDQVIILKKLKQNHEKRKSVVIERLCFKNSIKKITQYLSDEKIEVEGKLVAYHAAGNFLSGVKSYMTESTPKYNTVGGGNVLIDGFVGTFGDAFDATVIEDGEKISAGQLSIVDIDMVVNSDNDAYKVEIPKIKAVYTHMLGQDCHSIIIGAGHANATIANLQSYLDKSYKIFLSTHYGPETR